MENINVEYNKLLLSELRMAVIPDEVIPVSDESITKAITLNENLKALGYTVRAKDIITLATRNIDGFFEEFKKCIDEVKAKPMYPDFPKQVMEIDEAEFRLHQMCHYFTTYGIESLTGQAVRRGWLPDMNDTEKTVDDKTLLEAKVLELVPENEMFVTPFNRILLKNERMTDKEKTMVNIIVSSEEPGRLADEMPEIPFKENIVPVFVAFMDSDIPREDKLSVLHKLCQHTGDVWKCLGNYLDKHKWSLKTSQKRLLVRLFESYPISDFRTNLIITNQKASRVITLLEFLSFNSMSRSDAHRKAVAELRDGTLRSWQSFMHELIRNKDEGTLAFVGQRPGILLRSINWLLKEGFSKEEISGELGKHADALSLHTLVNVLTIFMTPDDSRDNERTVDVIEVVGSVMKEKMSTLDVPFREKKVFFDWKDVAPEFSSIGKTDEGGYVRSGMAIKLPEGSDILRFFVYWDDDRRVDIDLHAFAEDDIGTMSHIGWDSDFRNEVITHSGDIVHSNAAEYIDVCLSKADACYINNVDFFIHSYTGQTFNGIDKCFTGLLAVSEMGMNVETRLYNSKNVLWSHDLTTKSRGLHYGILDIPNRVIRVAATPMNMEGLYLDDEIKSSRFTFKEYFEMLTEAVNASIVSDRDDADLVLVPYKAESETELSILDNNLFLDAESRTVV